MQKFVRLTPTSKGLMLAGVLLVKRAPDGTVAMEGREERLLALLTVACGRPLLPSAMRYIRRAGQLFSEVSDADLDYADYFFPRPQNTYSGNDFPAIAKLTMMLALSGFTCAENPRKHLLKALRIVDRGMSPGVLLKCLGLAKDDGEEDSDDSDDGDGYNPDEPRIPAGNSGAGEWTTGGDASGAGTAGTKTPSDQGNNPSGYDTSVSTWGNLDTLDDHFDRHGGDFSATSPEDYANQANQFLQTSQAEGIQMKIEPEGYMRVYDPVTNTFGSYNPDGTTRTFFMPPEGQSYFDIQPGTLYVGGKQVNTNPESAATVPESMGEGGGGGGGIRPEGIYYNDSFLDSEEENPIE